MGVQVNLATKDGKGNALPFSKRQFISFSYGGKNIEDFDLVVVFPSDRLDKEIYSPFKDITSTSDVMDGQIHWASFFEAGRLNLTLATDGMTSENYENFKKWFKPGIAKEFILSEFHNRVTYARVAAAPQISLLPFEDKRAVKIGVNSYEFSTSLYKGEIQIEFVMDEPYWHAKDSYFENLLIKNTEKIDTDKIKAIYEDKIPVITMLDGVDNIILLADNQCYNNKEIKTQENLSLNSKKTSTTSDGKALIEYEGLYLYNCGSAPAKPIIEFSLKPTINEKHYISLPGNKQYAENDYSYLKIGEEEFKYTTPSILTSYNQAVKILSEVTDGADILTVRQRIRDELHDYYTRAWVLALLDAVKNANSEEGTMNTSDASAIVGAMPHFILKEEKKEDGTTELIYRDFTFTIDSKIGTVNLKTQIFAATGITYEYTTNEETSTTTSSFSTIEGDYIEIVENAGDMVKSKYIQLEEQTSFTVDTNNKLVITTNECLPIVSSCPLTNFSIDFKYTYL